MGQHEVDAGGLTGISQPIPAEHALGTDSQVVPVGSDKFEEELEVIVFDVGVDPFFALPVHQADIHLARMQVDSAIEFSRGGMILHNRSFDGCHKTPG